MRIDKALTQYAGPGRRLSTPPVGPPPSRKFLPPLCFALLLALSAACEATVFTWGGKVTKPQRWKAG